MRKLDGKVAIVTGGGQTVGLGVAQALADGGADLVITGRVREKLEMARADLQGRGAKVMVCPGDVSVRESADAAVAMAADAFGRVDILVNNAQTNKAGKIEEIDEEAFDITFGSGFRGTLYHMQAAFPYLKERGGSVINFGSKMGMVPHPNTGLYSATKEAIRALSRVAAKEWGQYGIRVNIVNPASLGEKQVANLASNPDLADQVKRDLTLGYFGDPRLDIGSVVAFLASDDARYLTGQTLNADGGQVML